MQKTVLAAATIAFFFATPAQAAAELVTNGGFETGNFSGWTQGGNSGFDGVISPGPSADVHSGNSSAFFGAVGSTSTLSQTLATSTGQSYNISFWFLGFGDSPSSINVDFDGTSLLSLTNPGSGSYTLYSFLATASSASTALTFTMRDDPGFMFLDDVSVQAVPEASTWAMMLLGFGLIGSTLRVRRRRAQLSPA